MRRCSTTPTAPSCARPTWSGRLCCASSTASTRATGIEILQIRRYVGFQLPLHYESKRRPITGGVFALGRVLSPPHLPRQLRQCPEDARPGADALMEALEVVFLVRRVDIVVVETESNEQRIEAEGLLEIGDN